jgi:predicted  nucleic acid-binding Zn-ribbon protein
VAAETERSDIEREQEKADTDVQQVRKRADRDRARLESGQVNSPKDLQNLQHEVESLARRQSELEDVELAIMERLEDVERHLTGLRSQQETVAVERATTLARRDSALVEIDDEAALVTQARATASGQIDGALVTLYEKVREQQGGTGAAALQHRRCQGCRLELNNTDINRIKAAAEDEVLRCEECRRILVRTPESGV